MEPLVDRDQEFPVTKHWSFFNHAATSPLPMRAVKGAGRQLSEQAINGAIGNPWWAALRNRMRGDVARMINASDDEVAFVGNTAEGLGIYANGFRFRHGDNVVLAAGEYPANVYPWMNLDHRGVGLNWVKPDGPRLDVGAIAKAIDARTRVVAVSWVSFATGFRIDLDALGEVCRARNVRLVVDAIQGLGAFPLDVRRSNIDFLASGGQKWLLGPRGCGVVYASRRALDEIDTSIVGAYGVVDDEKYLDYDLTVKPTARRFEYGTENSVGLAALQGSTELLLEIGIDKVSARIVELTDHFVEAVRSRGYEVTSPRREGEKSGLVFFTKPGLDVAATNAVLKERRFVVSVRAGQLRFAPHVYNTLDEVQAFLEALP